MRQDLVARDAGVSTVTDENGDGVFVGSAPVRLEDAGGVTTAPGWTLVLRQDVSEVLAPANAILRDGLLAALAALVIATFLSVLFARSLTRPINDLVGVARRVSKGDLSRTAKVTSRDEIGTLGATFNDRCYAAPRIGCAKTTAKNSSVPKPFRATSAAS